MSQNKRPAKSVQNRISILKSEIKNPPTTEERTMQLKIEIKSMLQIIEYSQL